MRKCLISNNLKVEEILPLLGNNLLKGLDPIVLDGEDKELEGIRYRGMIDKKRVDVISGDWWLEKHLDFESDSSKIIYDLGEEKVIDRIFISGFYNGFGDFSLSEYKIHIANDPKELFGEESCVVHYNNGELCELQTERNHCDQIFDLEDYKGRYFALHILKACNADDIARITTIGVYNHKFTEQTTFCSRNFEYNFLKGKIPSVVGTYTKDLTPLTDSVCFDENSRTYLNADTEFSFKFDSKLNIGGVYVVGSESAIENCELSAAMEKEDLFSENNLLEAELCEVPSTLPGAAAMFIFGDDIEAKYIGFQFKSGDYIDQLGVQSKSRVLKLDSSKVLADDFHGFGVNCLPMAFMPEALGDGFNDAYWELEKKRIITSRPAVVRLWFQPDWMLESFEDYQNGVYNFKSDKMKSVYKYLDAFLLAGSEIEFNFGWKASKDKCEWFNVKNPDTTKPWNSAPDHLDLFAKCCSETLRELIINRGYSNIKYLTFYNESAYGTISDIGDFNLQGRCAREYFCEMYLTVMKQLEADGILPLITPWAAEQSGPDSLQYEWTKLVADKLSDYAKMTTQHRYNYSYDELMEFFGKHLSLSHNRKMIISEYGVGNGGTPEIDWDHSHVAYTMAVHNSGYSGALLWTMSGINITDPCSFLMDNDIDLWGYIVRDDEAVERVKTAFYETSLQMKYIPNHSKSVAIFCDYDDMRAAAWEHGEDMTIAIASKENEAGRIISLDLGRNINKPVYRHVYKASLPHEGNAIIPHCDKVLNASDMIVDEIDGEYQMVVYTTLPPVSQVAFDSVKIKIKAGETLDLEARLIDAKEGSELEWSIAACVGSEGKLENGSNTADKKAKSGDMVALKAAVNGSETEYGIILIVVE